MNKNLINRQLAINYAVLCRLVQNEQAVRQVINKDNFHELSNVERFYREHFNQSKFLQNFPIVSHMLKREVETAFSSLKARTHIYHRYDPEYPKALIQDLKDDAPLFMYSHGDESLLDRKNKRLACVTLPLNHRELIEKSHQFVRQIEGLSYTLLLRKNSSLDKTLIKEAIGLAIPVIKFLNQPLLKDESKKDTRKVASLKVLNISFTGPMDAGLDEIQSIMILNSLGKITIVFSDDARDVQHIAVVNNSSWYKPSYLPFIKLPAHQLEHVYTDDSEDDLKSLLERLSV